jgi:hypothetical protein
MDHPARDEIATEFRRLAGASSLLTVLTSYVDDLRQLSRDQSPDWVRRLPVPQGWRIAGLAGAAIVPARIAVSGRRPDGGWDGCETLSAFAFTGEAPPQVVRDHADSTLRSLGAEHIDTKTAPASVVPGGTAVRSEGLVTIAGRQVWAQHSTYVIGSTAPGRGRLVQQSITISAGYRARFAEDIALLSTTVPRGFFSAVDDR